MKRVLLVIALVIVAAIAGIVRSHTHISRNGLRFSVSQNPSGGEARDEIRKTFDLTPGARVSVSGINGAVNVETADIKTAEVYILRTGETESLNLRKVVIENSSNSLSIRTERGDVGFFERLFGRNPREQVTLKLPRHVSLVAKGVNGSVIVGDLDGSVEVSGVNGKVQVGQATGSAEFRGINGNISVALKQLDTGGVSIRGINGNIELRLADGLNADLDAHGMNGSVHSEIADVVVDKSEHGSKYSAHIGTGGSPITVSGVNGNVRLTRAAAAAGATAEESKSGN
jgi:hypothetical protein